MSSVYLHVFAYWYCVDAFQCPCRTEGQPTCVAALFSFRAPKYYHFGYNAVTFVRLSKLDTLSFLCITNS